jgi:hypothetical protein
LNGSDLLPRSTITSSNGSSFSTSAIKERCAQGQVLVPLWVWLLFQKRMGGPSYGAHFAACSVATQTFAITGNNSCSPWDLGNNSPASFFSFFGGGRAYRPAAQRAPQKPASFSVFLRLARWPGRRGWVGVGQRIKKAGRAASEGYVRSSEARPRNQHSFLSSLATRLPYMWLHLLDEP